MRFAVLALLLTACVSKPQLVDPRTVRTPAQAKIACEVKAEVLLAKSDTCTEGQLRVDNLARLDPDCLQYFGDAGAPTIQCIE